MQPPSTQLHGHSLGKHLLGQVHAERESGKSSPRIYVIFMGLVGLGLSTCDTNPMQEDDPENFSETLIVNYASGKTSASGASWLHSFSLLG